MDDDEASRPYTADESERLRRIEEELEKAKSVRFEEPDDSEALSSRLEEIEARARSARAGHEKQSAAGSTSGIKMCIRDRAAARR